MAEYQKIEYRIGKDGKVTETVINGSGETCTLATQDIEASLGKVESREILPEYHDDGADNFLVNEQSQSNENQGY
ncbi:DUF2997 domain-containing protein [Chamaesiphon sp. VAR_48_metabat_403]|uniref:DUF2997 domain-containing protein n=1 Tax=Chamaesiphon sp. VAR_48_metabat_403 TaxID=2964700 RepID=UPI00286E79DB|nr:DUF2997 domain-containing protein [Chamaesiphon sp. VAR_48_metabat_403]